MTDKVPDTVRAQIQNAVRAATTAPNREVADMIAADVLSTYQRDYPAAMHSSQGDWEESVAYLQRAAIHHKRIRITNLLERSFLQKRRRTRTIPRLHSEKSCLNAGLCHFVAGQPALAGRQNELHRASATQTPSTPTRIAARWYTK
jgi:transposase-like protein